MEDQKERARQDLEAGMDRYDPNIVVGGDRDCGCDDDDDDDKKLSLHLSRISRFMLQ